MPGSVEAGAAPAAAPPGAPAARGGRVARFLLVGGASAGLDVGLLVGLRELLGVPVPVATTVAFFTALVFNYSLHRAWTFASADRPAAPWARALGPYAVLVVANWVATLAIVTGSTAVGVPYAVGKVVAVAVIALCTFVAYDRWVFAGVER
jgi:putative flippase GtrA